MATGTGSKSLFKFQLYYTILEKTHLRSTVDDRAKLQNMK